MVIVRKWERTCLKKECSKVVFEKKYDWMEWVLDHWNRHLRSVDPKDLFKWNRAKNEISLLHYNSRFWPLGNPGALILLLFFLKNFFEFCVFSCTQCSGWTWIWYNPMSGAKNLFYSESNVPRELRLQACWCGTRRLIQCCDLLQIFVRWVCRELQSDIFGITL